MLEPWRSQYLHALGIDVYVPRSILPGAKPSAPCEWDWPEQTLVEAISPAVEPVAEVAAETVAVAAAAPAAERRSPIVEQRATPPREESAPAPRVERAAVPRFALGVTITENGLLIVDDAPPNTQARAEYLRLLSNLSFALRRGAGNPSLDVFIWPMVKNNPQIDQSAGAAREAIAAYLEKQIHQHGLQAVLLLGENAQRWLPEASRQQWGVACAASTSAWSVLRNSALKRELWRNLRDLAVAP